jgi:ribosomal protein L7/L12
MTELMMLVGVLTRLVKDDTELTHLVDMIRARVTDLEWDLNHQLSKLQRCQGDLSKMTTSNTAYEKEVKFLREVVDTAVASENKLRKQVGKLQDELDSLRESKAEETVDACVRVKGTISKKIPFIKALREVTNLGLREAKEFIESLYDGEWHCIPKCRLTPGQMLDLKTRFRDASGGELTTEEIDVESLWL